MLSLCQWLLKTHTYRLSSEEVLALKQITAKSGNTRLCAGAVTTTAGEAWRKLRDVSGDFRSDGNRSINSVSYFCDFSKPFVHIPLSNNNDQHKSTPLVQRHRP